MRKRDLLEKLIRTKLPNPYDPDKLDSTHATPKIKSCHLKIQILGLKNQCLN
jgi:hypothetical protein